MSDAGTPRLASGSTLRVHRILDRTSAEGPGLRSALWVQGCSLACPGCFNARLWDTDCGDVLPVERVVDRLLAVQDVDGVTLLGGEPFEQALPLAEVAEAVRRAGRTVMVFSGYRLAEIQQAGRHAGRLLAATDLLVDGRYDRDAPDHRRPWVGSTNQRFHFLTERLRWAEPITQEHPNRLEVRIGPDGAVGLNGMLDTQRLGAIRRVVREAGSGQ